MCKAFSCIVMKNGDVKWKFGMDSHDKILKYFGISDNDDPEFHEMKFARVEITPNNGNYLFPDEWGLKIDERIIPVWFTESYEIFAFDAHKKWLKELDKILIRKKIINPFIDFHRIDVTKEELKLLKEWNSVRDSVWDFAGTSVWASVRDSIWVYYGSFFNLEPEQWLNCENIKFEKYPFECVVKLWENGLVPSFDGKIWILHGHEGKIIWKGTIEDLDKEINND